jgi:hypothetical protein
VGAGALGEGGGAEVWVVSVVVFIEFLFVCFLVLFV